MIRLYERLVECSLRVRKDDPYERIENMKKLYALNKDYTLFYEIGHIYEKETKDEANAYHYYKKYMDMITKNGKLLVDNNGNRTNKGQGLTWEARIQEDIIRFFIYSPRGHTRFRLQRDKCEAERNCHRKRGKLFYSL